jgi:hypothetical protein
MYQQVHINMEQALKTDIDVKTIYHLIPSLVLSRGPPMNCHFMMGSDIKYQCHNVNNNVGCKKPITLGEFIVFYNEQTKI